MRSKSSSPLLTACAQIQGLEFDGGSLIEAGVDDLIIHDVATSLPSLRTRPWRRYFGLARAVLPNHLHAAGWLPGAQVQLVDATGRSCGATSISANARGERPTSP